MDAEAATLRYKSLEQHIQRLEISQRKREQSLRSKRRLQSKTADTSGPGRRTLPAIRPSTVPARTTNPNKKTPTEEVNERRDIEDEFEARMQELLDEKMSLNKKFSAATSQEYRLQKQIRDKKNALATLVDQDNINQRRGEMMKKCQHEKEVLAKTNMQMAILSNYQRTLDLMKNRLWLNQTTFQKTMDAYYATVEAAKAEVTDVTKMKENMALKLTKARERNKKFKVKAAEYMENLQRQLNGLRVMDEAYEQDKAQHKLREQARLSGRERRMNESRAKDITSRMREANDQKKQEALLEKMSEHEEAFRKIQMASGLETDEEIIDAFNNREAYLSDVVRKVDMLRRQLNEAQKRHNHMKEAFVSELVENDAPASASLVMNLWGGPKGSEDLSTEQLQEHRLQLQRSLREQAKVQDFIIKFAQAVEGLFTSIAPMMNSSLEFESFLGKDASDGSSGTGAGGNGSSGSSGKRGGSRSRPASGRPSSSRSSGGSSRKKAVLSFVSHPDDGRSILNAEHLNQRVKTIDTTVARLAAQIMSLSKAFKEGDTSTQKSQNDNKAKAAKAAKEAEVEAETEAQTQQDAQRPRSADASLGLGPEYEAKVADFMWAQKFAVRNNIRVKSVAVTPHPPDDRHSFFLKETKAQRDREQMDEEMDDNTGAADELAAVVDDGEDFFDRDSMKKLSISLVNKNTRRQRRSPKKSKDAGDSPKRTSPSPRRGSKSIRSSAPGDN